MKTVGTKLDNSEYEIFEFCCSENGLTKSEQLRDLIKDFVNNKPNDDPLEINVEDIEPITEDKLRIFDCDSGIMYENGNVVGNCSEFDLRQGKVFDKSGKQIGITQGLKSILELKNPTVELIYD